jgi:aspartokinase-like uncharacterized kinase
MIVLKLGGSLLSKPNLQQWLSLVSQQGKGQLVIVPGGGVFADQVRVTQKQWQYSDKIAHQMAILATHQMALLFKGLCADLVLTHKIASITAILQKNKVLVWLPDITELEALGVAETWDITSDSLAVYLAKQLKAETVFLIKSANIPGNASLQQLTAAGIVDKACAETAEKLQLNVQCLQNNQLSFFETILVNHG